MTGMRTHWDGCEAQHEDCARARAVTVCESCGLRVPDVPHGIPVIDVDGRRTGWMCAACVHDADPICHYGDCHELAQLDTYCGFHFRRIRNEYIQSTNRYRGD